MQRDHIVHNILATKDTEETCSTRTRNTEDVPTSIHAVCLPEVMPSATKIGTDISAESIHIL